MLYITMYMKIARDFVTRGANFLTLSDSSSIVSPIINLFEKCSTLCPLSIEHKITEIVSAAQYMMPNF